MGFSFPSYERNSHWTNIPHPVEELLSVFPLHSYDCVNYSSAARLLLLKQSFGVLYLAVVHLYILPSSQLWEGCGHRWGRVISHHTCRGYKLESVRFWLQGKWVPFAEIKADIQMQRQTRTDGIRSREVYILEPFLWSLKGYDFGWVMTKSTL